MEMSDGVISEFIQWQIPKQCKFSREGDLRLERESGTAPLKETGMEEEGETGVLRSLGNWGQGEELGLVKIKREGTTEGETGRG